MKICISNGGTVLYTGRGDAGERGSMHQRTAQGNPEHLDQFVRNTSPDYGQRFT
jgi:hypothetical protein